MRLALPFATCLFLASAATLAYAATTGAWVQIDEDEGIRIWKLEVPGVEVPGFRGETTMNASPERIVEELKHVEWHTQWMYRCSESSIIKRIDEDAALVYNRTDTPWPVWDRDAVLDTAFTTSADNKVVTLTFKNTDPTLRPLPENVIRMPRLEGSYRMDRLAEGKTRVTYTVEVDIGGSVPSWMARMVARDMPYRTLSSLRKRITR